MESEDETESEGGTGSGSGVEFEEAGSSDDADEEGHEDAQEEHERDVDVSAVGNKRKRSAKTMHPIEAKRSKPSTSRRKVQRVAQSKSFSSHLVRSVLSPAELPVDPYQRAMRLLHVGATPESLPCREEEFVDVLSKVEEGVDSGGGGCLCKGHQRTLIRELITVQILRVYLGQERQRRCMRWSKNSSERPRMG